MKQPETTYRDISPLIAADLRRGNAVRFMAQGGSMEPFLKAGDFVVVEPFNSTRKCVAPPRGTVMLYELPSGAHRLHRFTRTARGDNGSTLFRFRGDTPGHPAELIKPEQVLGTLVSCERDGCVTSVSNSSSERTSRTSATHSRGIPIQPNSDVGTLANRRSPRTGTRGRISGTNKSRISTICCWPIRMG